MFSAHFFEGGAGVGTSLTRECGEFVYNVVFDVVASYRYINSNSSVIVRINGYVFRARRETLVRPIRLYFSISPPQV